MLILQVVQGVLVKVEVIVAASEQERVVLLLRLQISNLGLGYDVLKRFEVILICLCVLDQVLFDWVIFVFVTVIMAAKKCIKWKTIILHTVAITHGSSSIMQTLIVYWLACSNLRCTLSLYPWVLIDHLIVVGVSDRVGLVPTQQYIQLVTHSGQIWRRLWGLLLLCLVLLVVMDLHYRIDTALLNASSSWVDSLTVWSLCCSSSWSLLLLLWPTLSLWKGWVLVSDGIRLL